MPCQTPYRGDTSQMLLFKIASCLADGSFISGVSSFNSRTGAVTLTSGDVITALGFTPISESDGDARYVLKSGDTMTGALTIGNGVLVASEPALSLNQTWNNAAVTFTGLLSNVTNTASAADSNLFNFQTDGIDRFRFASIGQLFATRQDATNSGVTFFQRKRGSLAGATAAVAADATIGTLTHSGWDGTAYANGSRISGLANTLWTNTNHGSRIDLYTTPDGSTSEQITLRLAATGQALFTDGTAALPALSFQTDLNTGIYRIGADSLGLSTAGVLRATLNADGNLGIGVAPVSSLTRLSVEAPDGARSMVFSGATIGILFGFSATGSVITGADKTGAVSYQQLSFDGLELNWYISGVGKTQLSTDGFGLLPGVPLRVFSGANQRAGNATLVAGTVTVANTSVTANTIVLLTRKTAGGTLGTAITYTVSAGTSFTINSDSVIDTSTFSYLLIEVP